MESVYENSTTSEKLIIKEYQTESIVERILIEDGIKMYIKGCQFPQKSCPSPEAIVAINTVKRVIISFLTSRLIPLSRHSLIRTFNRICYDPMCHHFLKEKYLTKISREFQKVIYKFLVNWSIEENQAVQASKILSHVFEYDNAYRYRFQDIVSEIKDKNDLLKRKEWIRLASILYDRDDVATLQSDKNGDRRVGKQFKLAAKLFSLLLYIPSFRKALKDTLPDIDLSKFIMDDGDWYWAYYRKDYNFGGLDYNKRMEMFKSRGFKLPTI